MFTYGFVPGGGGGATNLDGLTDVTIPAAEQWAGPANVLVGSGAPSSGTGVEGDFYVDEANVFPWELYGPKDGAGNWPFVGIENVDFTSSSTMPVGFVGQGYIVQFVFDPINLTYVPTGVWGPFDPAGVSDTSLLGYDQATRQWVPSTGEVVDASEGGNYKMNFIGDAQGVASFQIQDGSFQHHILTDNADYAAGGSLTRPPRPQEGTRAFNFILVLEQGNMGGYTVTWPSSVSWADGQVPYLSTNVGAKDVFDFVSVDNGQTWLGSFLRRGDGEVDQLNEQTVDYTFVREDAGKVVTLAGTNNRDFTIPAESAVPFPLGTRITVATVDTGHMTIVGDTGVTVTGTTVLNQAGHIGEIIKVGPDFWISHL